MCTQVQSSRGFVDGERTYPNGPFGADGEGREARWRESGRGMAASVGRSEGGETGVDRQSVEEREESIFMVTAMDHLSLQSDKRT
jgi:hypothetical protein